MSKDNSDLRARPGESREEYERRVMAEKKVVDDALRELIEAVGIDAMRGLRYFLKLERSNQSQFSTTATLNSALETWNNYALPEKWVSNRSYYLRTISAWMKVECDTEADLVLVIENVHKLLQALIEVHGGEARLDSLMWAK